MNYSRATSGHAWPSDLAHPREFSRHAEDTPFVDWLQIFGQLDNRDDDTDMSSDDEDEPEEVVGGRTLGERASSSTDLEVGLATPEHFDLLDRVKMFLAPVQGMEHGRLHLDDEDVILGFCQRASRTQPVDKSDRMEPLIAIVDSRGSGWAGSKRLRDGMNTSQRRGLTQVQLYEELRIPRSQRTRPSEKGEVAGDRRLIYLPDMDESGISVLAATASRTQRRPLINFLYNHITLSPCLDATVTTQGFKTFTFQFSLPFYVLRQHSELRRDTRQKPDDQPLRRSWVLDCLPRPSPPSSLGQRSWCLYEAHQSALLTGIDDRVWTAYAVMDTYYDPNSRNSAEYHEREWSKRRVLLDPMTGNGGTRELGKSWRDARMYFLSVLEAYANNYLLELDTTTRVMGEAIDDRHPDRFAASSVKAHSNRNEEMIQHLTKLISSVSEAVRLWAEFENGDVGYFLSGDNEKMHQYVQSISKTYSRIREKLARLESLRDALQDRNRYLVQSFWGFRTLEVAKTAMGLFIVPLVFSHFTQVFGLLHIQSSILPLGATKTVICVALVYAAAYCLLSHGERFGNYVSTGVQQWVVGSSNAKGAMGSGSPSGLQGSSSGASVRRNTTTEKILRVSKAATTTRFGDTSASRGCNVSSSSTSPIRLENRPFEQSGSEITSSWEPMESDSDAESVLTSESCSEDEEAERLLSAKKEEFVDLIVNECVKKHGIGQTPHGSATNGGETSSRREGTTSTSSGRPRARGSGKGRGASQVHRNGDDSDDDNPSGNQDSPEHGEVEFFFACPFFKANPLTHRKCGNKVLRDPSRVKFHLWRCHYFGIHCPVCFEKLPGEKQLDAHIRTRGCVLQDRPPLYEERITGEQRAQIRKRADSKKSKADNWFDIFRILFPAPHPLPVSPYIDALHDSSGELGSLKAFISRGWREIFDTQVTPRLPEHLQQHSGAIQDFSQAVFEDAVARLLTLFEESHQESASDRVLPAGSEGTSATEHVGRPVAETAAQYSAMAPVSCTLDAAASPSIPLGLSPSGSQDFDPFFGAQGDPCDDQNQESASLEFVAQLHEGFGDQMDFEDGQLHGNLYG
ncbi:hypothetical protein OQA88_3281 [Cercophora sp. LCS_1]